MNLNNRLQLGDLDIDKLDRVCKAHDIACEKDSDSAKHSLADCESILKTWGECDVAGERLAT